MGYGRKELQLFSVVVVIHRLGQRAPLKTNTYIKERALSEMINHETKKIGKVVLKCIFFFTVVSTIPFKNHDSFDCCKR